MNKVRIDDRMPRFKRRMVVALDTAMRESSGKILAEATLKAPKDKGHLRADVEINHDRPLHWRISFNKEYAAAQEAGRTRGYKIRKYTTPGTGAHFLENAGDNETDRIVNRFRKHSRVI